MDTMLEEERLSIHPRNFGNHLTYKLFRPHHSHQGDMMSDFLASVGACNVILHIHVVIS